MRFTVWYEGRWKSFATWIYNANILYNKCCHFFDILTSFHPKYIFPTHPHFSSAFLTCQSFYSHVSSLSLVSSYLLHAILHSHKFSSIHKWDSTMWHQPMKSKHWRCKWHIQVILLSCFTQLAFFPQIGWSPKHKFGETNMEDFYRPIRS